MTELYCIPGGPARNGQRFNPDFPVTCPFVTAVGATQVNPGSTVNDPEGACEQVIFSGGGFSNFFAMPDYQATAVTSFLTNHPPPFTSAQFNNSGNVGFFPGEMAPDLLTNGIFCRLVDSLTCLRMGKLFHYFVQEFNSNKLCISANYAVGEYRCVCVPVTSLSIMPYSCCGRVRPCIWHIVLRASGWLHDYPHQRCSSCSREGASWYVTSVLEYFRLHLTCHCQVLLTQL